MDLRWILPSRDIEIDGWLVHILHWFHNLLHRHLCTWVSDMLDGRDNPGQWYILGDRKELGPCTLDDTDRRRRHSSPHNPHCLQTGKYRMDSLVAVAQSSFLVRGHSDKTDLQWKEECNYKVVSLTRKNNKCVNLNRWQELVYIWRPLTINHATFRILTALSLDTRISTSLIYAGFIRWAIAVV